MAGKYPTSSGMRKGDDGGPMLCAEWEALLVDALDGTLPAEEKAAFEAHRESCLACAQLLDEARRGGEWLQFLETEPQVPSDLVSRILAQTSGATDALPLIPPGAGAAAIAGPGWQQAGWLPRMEKHAAQSRWMMTAAMAFFSIAFTLNLTGIRLTGLRLGDLKPTSIANTLTRQFYVADAHVMRYYDNLRFVYELESRVREIRQDNKPEQTAPTPVEKNTPKSSLERGGKPDGASEKAAPSAVQLPKAAPPATDHQSELRDGPVFASLYQNSTSGCKAVRALHNKKRDRAERSLA